MQVKTAGINSPKLMQTVMLYLTTKNVHAAEILNNIYPIQLQLAIELKPGRVQQIFSPSESIQLYSLTVTT
jgi:hypothetical protein